MTHILTEAQIADQLSSSHLEATYKGIGFEVKTLDFRGTLDLEHSETCKAIGGVLRKTYYKSRNKADTHIAIISLIQVLESGHLPEEK